MNDPALVFFGAGSRRGCSESGGQAFWPHSRQYRPRVRPIHGRWLWVAVCAKGAQRDGTAAKSVQLTGGRASNAVITSLISHLPIRRRCGHSALTSSLVVENPAVSARRAECPIRWSPARAWATGGHRGRCA